MSRMREMVFTLEFDAGCDPVSDVLAEYSSARVRSLACHVTRDSFWRVDYADGPEDALEELVAVYREPSYCPDCLITDCGSDVQVEVLDAGEEFRVLYVHWTRSSDCNSIPHLAFDYLGPGFLVETSRVERTHQWRILTPDGTDVGGLNAAVWEEVCDCADVNLERLTDAESWSGPAVRDVSLTTEQREALAAAVENGYYETPREIDLGDLSDELDVPRSTLSYRLRRAEAELAETVAQGTESAVR